MITSTWPQLQCTTTTKATCIKKALTLAIHIAKKCADAEVIDRAEVHA